MSHLAVRGLRKTYGAVTALDHIDLDVAEGEFLTLLGPSGSGKTTLLMALAGFVQPDEGSVAVGGRDILGIPPEDRDFGMVFQGYALFPHMSVTENIAFPLRVRRWDKARVAARVREMIDLVALGGMAERKPRQLSGGQQQRVALARAMAFSPKLLLLDEPLSALDRHLRGTMQRELKRLHRETGVTFLYVTHDQDEALAMSDRIAVFNHGRIEQLGTPRALYRKPDSRFVAEFLGTNNLFSGRVATVNGASATIEALGTTLRVPTLQGAAPVSGSKVELWIRPDDLRLGATPGAIDVPVTILDVSYGGMHDRVTARSADGTEWTIQHPGDAGPAVKAGEPATMALPADRVGLVPR